MRRGFELGAVAAAFVLAGGLGCTTEERDVDAAALYARTCARCHGEGGEGGLAAAPGEPAPRDLTDPAWQRSRSDVELGRVLRAGTGSMPSFADVLAPADLDALVVYVRSLAGASGAVAGATDGGSR